MAKKLAENSENNENNSRKKATGRPFEKGKSGNPGGRPKKTVERIEADQKADDALNMLKNALPEATQKVLALLDDPNTQPNVRVKILELMLDRTYGKAFQSMQIDAGEKSTCGIVFMPKRGDHD